MVCSVEEALYLQKEWRRSIANDWLLLSIIVGRHEKIIQQRWVEMTKQERKELLLSIWPNMPESHRPDIVASKQSRDTEDLDAYMFPTINLEDLTRKEPLLLMIKSRGREQPNKFAYRDARQSSYGRALGKFGDRFIDIQFHDNISGRLIAYEIQTRIYSFVLNSCKRLLPEFSDEQLRDTIIPIQAEPPEISAVQPSSLMESVAVASFEAQYGYPAQLNIKFLQDVVQSRLAAAKDHLWDLREDPAYFFNCIADWQEHFADKFDFGVEHRVSHSSSKDWASAVRQALPFSMKSVDMWDNIYMKLAQLREAMAEDANLIHPLEPLPHGSCTSYQEIWMSLGVMTVDLIELLVDGFGTSPFLRSRMVISGEDGSIDLKPGYKWSTEEKKFFWIFSTLFKEKGAPRVALKKALLTDLDLLLQRHPKLGDYVTPWMASMLSDISIVIVVLDHLDSMLWSVEVQQKLKANLATVHQRYQKEMSHTIRLGGEECHVPWLDLARCADPEKGDLHYPIDQVYTKETNSAMQNAEANLDNLWRKLLFNCKKIDALSANVFAVLYGNVLGRTRSWIDPTAEAVEATTSALSELSTSSVNTANNMKRNLKKFNNNKKKKKKKTRGQWDANKAPPQQRPKSPVKTPVTKAQQVFKVDKRAMKVFSTLLFEPSTSCQPGMVPWKEFLRAFQMLGFTAKHLGGGGSAWNFTPPDTLGYDRSIDFHEPHGKGKKDKLPFYQVKRYGKRLTKAYNWNLDMFQLDK